VKKIVAAWPVAVQAAGGAGLTYGLGMAFGLAVSLMFAGVSLLAVGTLAEMRRS
jgi:hypothetical protein